jgi:hypothetical protein
MMAPTVIYSYHATFTYADLEPILLKHEEGEEISGNEHQEERKSTKLNVELIDAINTSNKSCCSAKAHHSDACCDV